MKSPLLALALCALLMPCTAHASTVLLTHNGSTNPTTEGWSRSIVTSTVIGEAYDDNGTPVWRLTDPGDPGASSAHLYYHGTVNATNLNTALTQGWELSATIKIPENDPTSGVAWTTSSNTWLGFIAPEATNVRRYWALIFGRSATGDTLVQANGGGPVKTLAPGYHDYSLVYDPVTARVTISIDGEVWQTGYNGTTTAGSTATVYWGDNNSQSADIPNRSAYYESVQFSVGAVPEPSRFLLLGLGVLMLQARRRR